MDRSTHKSNSRNFARKGAEIGALILVGNLYGVLYRSIIRSFRNKVAAENRWRNEAKEDTPYVIGEKSCRSCATGRGRDGMVVGRCLHAKDIRRADRRSIHATGGGGPARWRAAAAHTPSRGRSIRHPRGGTTGHSGGSHAPGTGRDGHICAEGHSALLRCGGDGAGKNVVPLHSSRHGEDVR